MLLSWRRTLVGVPIETKSWGDPNQGVSSHRGIRGRHPFVNPSTCDGAVHGVRRGASITRGSSRWRIVSWCDGLRRRQRGPGYTTQQITTRMAARRKREGGGGGGIDTAVGTKTKINYMADRAARSIQFDY